MIYFDNAATTFPKPDCVYESVGFAMKNYAFNAGRGSYSAAQSTFKMIEETREKIASLSGCNGNDVVFCPSATNAINSIIVGLNLSEKDYVYVSPFEHNAIIRTLKFYNVNIIVIPFDKLTWKVDYNKLNDLFVLNKPTAVMLSHISNVTGFLLPYEEIFTLAKKYGSVNILDAAQSYGVKKVNTNSLDFIVFAGHKSLYALFGIAGYINVNKISLLNTIIGGTGSDSLNEKMPDEMPFKYEAGSPNSIAIYSLNKSIDFLKVNNIEKIESKMVQYFIEKAKKVSKIKIYLPENYISSGIVSFNIEGYTSDEVGTILSEEFDICVRTGYHCAPYIHDLISSKEYLGTVRVSFGAFNTIEEVDILVSALAEL